MTASHTQSGDGRTPSSGNVSGRFDSPAEQPIGANSINCLRFQSGKTVTVGSAKPQTVVTRSDWSQLPTASVDSRWIQLLTSSQSYADSVSIERSVAGSDSNFCLIT